MSQVLKITEKVPASDVCKKVDYLLNTGNLVTQTGLDLQQVPRLTSDHADDGCSLEKLLNLCIFEAYFFLRSPAPPKTLV